jgi:hypothetical protein
MLRIFDESVKTRILERLLSHHSILDVIPKYKIYQSPYNDVDDYYIYMPGHRPTGLSSMHSSDYGAVHTNEAIFYSTCFESAKSIIDIPYLIAKYFDLEYQPFSTRPYTESYDNQEVMQRLQNLGYL